MQRALEVAIAGGREEVNAMTAGAVGEQEIIHCLAMMVYDFVAPSISLDRLDPAFEGTPVVTQATGR